MWQIVGLQSLTVGVALASLFLKQSTDFSLTTSIILGGVTVLSAVLSIAAFRSQDADTRFLKRNIEHLVRSITLEAFARELIASQISKQVSLLGFPFMKSLLFSDGLSAFSFSNNESGKRKGLLLMSRDEFNRFATLDERELPSRLKSYMQEPLTNDPTQEWNRIVDELGRASRYVANELGADPSMSNRIWADLDKGRIGLATARHLQQPDITLDLDEIKTLQGLGRLERHARIANRIEQAMQPANPAVS